MPHLPESAEIIDLGAQPGLETSFTAMARRQELGSDGGSSRLTKQILGLATGAALGVCAYYGANKALRYLEVGHTRSLDSAMQYEGQSHCKGEVFYTPL